jgi:hypothetical protein
MCNGILDVFTDESSSLCELGPMDLCCQIWKPAENKRLYKFLYKFIKIEGNKKNISWDMQTTFDFS